MPVYTFQCGTCGRTWDRVFHMDEPHETAQCPDCRSVGTRQFVAPQISVFQPYVTRSFTGDPIRVTSPDHEHQLCRRHGVEVVSSAERLDGCKPAPPKLKPFRQEYAEVKRDFDKMGSEAQREHQNFYEQHRTALPVPS